MNLLNTNNGDPDNDWEPADEGPRLRCKCSDCGDSDECTTSKEHSMCSYVKWRDYITVNDSTVSKTFEEFRCTPIHEGMHIICRSKTNKQHKHIVGETQCCNHADFCNADFTAQVTPDVHQRVRDVPNPLQTQPNIPTSSIAIGAIVGGFALFVVLLIVACYWWQKCRQKTSTYSPTDVLMVPTEEGSTIHTAATSVPSVMLTHSEQELLLSLTEKRLIGQGRFGDVYATEWQCVAVAAKRFRNEYEDLFQHEKDIYRGCSLQNCYVLHMQRPIEEGLVLLYDFYPMGSLRACLEDRRLGNAEGILPVIDALSLMACVASALDYLYNLPLIESNTDASDHKARCQQMAHCAISSRNVFVQTDRRTCVLGEFGFAVRASASKVFAEDLNRPPHRHHDSRYLAPELLVDWPGNRSDWHQLHVLQAADMYAMALVFSEILRQTTDTFYTPPFGEYGVSNDPSVEVMQSLVCAADTRPSLPEQSQLTQLIEECWKREPMERLPVLRVKKSITQMMADMGWRCE